MGGEPPQAQREAPTLLRLQVKVVVINGVTMVEQWRVIPGFESYAASTLGRVCRIAPGRGTFVGREKRMYVWADRRTGYARVTVCLPGRSSGSRGSRRVPVAHLVLLAHRGRRRGRWMALHLDDDSTNCCLANLAWGSASTNLRQAYANNKRKRRAA